MFRVAVVHCLMLMMVAQPWICCCTASRLGAAMHAVAISLGATNGVPPAASCCSDHLRHRDKPVNAYRGPTAPTAPVDRSCPVRGESPAPATVSRSEAGVAFPSVRLADDPNPFAVPLASARVVTHLDDGLAGAGSYRVRSLRQVRDVLSAFQILRC